MPALPCQTKSLRALPCRDAPDRATPALPCLSRPRLAEPRLPCLISPCQAPPHHAVACRACFLFLNPSIINDYSFCASFVAVGLSLICFKLKIGIFSKFRSFSKKIFACLYRFFVSTFSGYKQGTKKKTEHCTKNKTCGDSNPKTTHNI